MSDSKRPHEDTGSDEERKKNKLQTSKSESDLNRSEEKQEDDRKISSSKSASDLSMMRTPPRIYFSSKVDGGVLYLGVYHSDALNFFRLSVKPTEKNTRTELYPELSGSELNKISTDDLDEKLLTTIVAKVKALKDTNKEIRAIVYMGDVNLGYNGAVYPQFLLNDELDKQCELPIYKMLFSGDKEVVNEASEKVKKLRNDDHTVVLDKNDKDLMVIYNGINKALTKQEDTVENTSSSLRPS